LHRALDFPALAEAVSLAAKVAQTSCAPALIVGEPGAPIEALARLIHERSVGARDGAWVVVRCQGVSEELVERELFGDSGADAASARPAVERARRGTLFIDRVSDLGASAQARLLALLEETAHDQRGSVRVVAAATTNLVSAVRERKFRADLLKRISLVTIMIPPLRAHVPDIERLALAFVEESARSIGKTIDGLSSDAMAKLRAYAFPANEEELRNAIDRAVIVETDRTLHAESIELRGPDREVFISDLVADFVEEKGRPATLAEVERAYITWMLRYTNGNRTAASRKLGISYPTIAKKISDYGIDFRSLQPDAHHRRGPSR
jgi:DNA-binding NtrC family response regulator